MNQKHSIQEVMAMVAEMELNEQEQLAHLILNLIHTYRNPTDKVYTWLDLEGMAPNMLEGEDAQTWVTRHRQEDTEARESIWKSGES